MYKINWKDFKENIDKYIKYLLTALNTVEKISVLKTKNKLILSNHLQFIKLRKATWLYILCVYGWHVNVGVKER